MTNRPSIALCCIMKNEAHNIGPMLQSVRGCFDQIHITDTGSTDNSVEFIEQINKHIDEGQPGWSGLPHIEVHHFDWVDDFSKAREYSFTHATTDYIMWIDLDDCLSDKDAFINWRDHLLHAAHQWLATYNYAYDSKGQVVCQFIRERVVKNNFGFKWHYFVHEGLLQTDPSKKVWTQVVSSWTINHRRTEEDIKQDHLRNVRLFEKQTDLPSRMKFYYGKELYENGRQKEAGKPLMEALKDPTLQLHDRMLSFQYAAQSAFSSNAFDQAIDICMNGLRLMPGRGELYCILGDAYLTKQDFNSAIVYFKNALNCSPETFGGVLVAYGHAYEEYPLTQLSKIYLTLCDFFRAKETIDVLLEKNYPVASELQKEFDRLTDLNKVRENLPKTQDVIITCPPGGPVTNWDENTLKEKGHGGSETAAIEVAKWIKQKRPDRRVMIFHTRDKRETMPSGVEYVPVEQMLPYLQNVEPAVHIGWRHTHRLTKAKSYVWCHDLGCPGAENEKAYDKIIALSEFHKEYLKEVSGVKDEKVFLGFNGVNPSDFPDHCPKDPLKVIFSSSPDRGLMEAIDVVRKAREISGLDIKLHCFYGFENMRKGGQGEWADQIEAHVRAHDFVTHYGQVDKRTLMKHFAESGVWLYPNDFIESYCITAIEAICSGCWPIVRDMGALKNTLKEAIAKDMCDFVTVEVLDEASVGIWANLLVEAIIEKKYLRVSVDIKNYTWERVADHFIKEMSL